MGSLAQKTQKHRSSLREGIEVGQHTADESSQDQCHGKYLRRARDVDLRGSQGRSPFGLPPDRIADCLLNKNNIMSTVVPTQ